jgi:branched-chain amino acid transport system permease protein
VSQFLQLLITSLTLGATYALAAIGFSIIYNASGVINFAQGEFIMLGGMAAAILYSAGLPLALAVLAALTITVAMGMLVERLAIEPARNASVTSIIIITIGLSLAIRGLVQLLFGKGTRGVPHFSGDVPINIFGATLLPQSLWVAGVTLLAVVLLAIFFGRTRTGKGILASAYNPTAALLVGINIRRVLLLSFALAAAVGAIGGILIAPITAASYDSGIMLGLKGFVAATLGGLGSSAGAIAGGLFLGLIETFTAGYISSAYKDAVPFVLVLVIFAVMPRGLFGLGAGSRV